MRPDCVEKVRQCEQRKQELEAELKQLKKKQQEAMAKRCAEYELFITGEYTKHEYQEAVSAFPLMDQWIDNLSDDLDRVSTETDAWRILADGAWENTAFKRVLDECVQKVVVNQGGVDGISITSRNNIQCCATYGAFI